MKTVSLVLLVLVCSGALVAQIPIASPVSLELGIGGGVTVPSGTLADNHNTGYHAGAKIRIKSLLPMNLVGFAVNSRLTEKSTDQTDAVWIIGAGLEYSLPGIVVSPYLGMDALLNIFDNQGAGTSSFNRGGLGLGGGVQFGLPGFGSFDASVKYQMLNIIGKDDGEDTVSQIAANLSLMFSIL